MKPIVTVSLLVMLVWLAASAQDTLRSVSGKSAKDTVEQFVKLDVEGTRLTPEGWQEADAIFVQPTRPPKDTVVVVIAEHYGVSESIGKEKEKTIKFDMGYEELGRIDSMLHFTPSNKGIETRSAYTYTLLLTNVYRTPDADQKLAERSPVPFEWRIDGEQPAETHITVRAARRYLSRMRDEADDHSAKQNAAKSLATLRPYR